MQKTYCLEEGNIVQGPTLITVKSINIPGNAMPNYIFASVLYELSNYLSSILAMFQDLEASYVVSLPREALAISN